MIHYNVKNRQSGRSMIEMLGVLAIVGVLSAGGIAGYSMAMQSYKTHQFVERVYIISIRARSIYKGNYSGINKNDLKKSGKLSANDLQNPFGGEFAIGVSTAGSHIFDISTGSSNIPKEACVDIIMMDWGSRAMLGSFLINGVPLQYPVTDMATAISACSSDNNRMLFAFR